MGQPINQGSFPGENNYWHPEDRRRAPIPIRKWLLLLVLGVLAWELVFSPRGFFSVWRLEHKKTQLEAELAALEAEHEQSKTQRQRLESGEAVEEVAREVHGYSREGEEIYIYSELQPASKKK